MRKALKLLAPISLLALAACSEAEETSANEEVAVAESDASAPASQLANATEPALHGNEPIPITLPKMAYVFDYGFRLAADAIAPLQQKHADMCEALGPSQCQIISLTRTGEGDDITGQLQLAVATEKARGFAELLSAAAERDDAESFRADIQGEDMSKTIVDTEARLRSRIALRDRLMEVLETRRGKVDELVAAERNVAQVNEEIDEAQSWLRETRGRVAHSRMTLTYETANPAGSFLKPIEGALGAVGSILGVIVAALILMAAVAGPFLLGALGFRRLARNRKEAATEA